MKFLDQVSGGQGPNKIDYGYTDAGDSPSMNAVGLLCRYYHGWGPTNPGMAAGVKTR